MLDKILPGGAYYLLILSIEFALLVTSDNAVDTFYRIEEITDRSIVVQCINKVSDILTHIAADVPFT